MMSNAPVEKEADLPGWNESKLLKILNSIKLSDEDTARLDAAAKALAKEREVPLEMLFRRCGK